MQKTLHDSPGLIRMFAQGKESAFRSIYEKYAPGLRYFAARYIVDVDGNEDVVQEAFVAVWKKRKDFTNEAGLKSYLYRTVRSLCLNILRHRKVEAAYVAGYAGADEITTFLDNITEAEIFSEVARAFQELSPASKRVYELSLEGKRHNEIAELLNISTNTIKKHKNTANHYLKRRLKDVL